MAAELKVVFRPPAEFCNNFRGRVFFDTEHGGRVSIEVCCAPRMCLPHVRAVGGSGILTKRLNYEGGLPLQVDFGEAVPGGQISRIIELDNEGSIPTGFNVRLLENNDENGAGKSDNIDVSENTEPTFQTAQQPLFLVKKGATGTLVGSTKGARVLFVFHPPADLKFEHTEVAATFQIGFDHPGVAPIFVECTGTVLASPLSLETDKIDFGTCAAGGCYRAKLLVTNRSPIAQRFWVEVAGITSGDLYLRPESPDSSSSRSARRLYPGGDASSLRGFSRMASDGLSSECGEAASIEAAEDFDDKLHEPRAGHDDSAGSLSSEAAQQMATPSMDEKRRIKKTGGRSDALCVQISDVGDLEVSPQLAFAQPNEPFTVWVKLRPTRAAFILLCNGDREFRVPLTVRHFAGGAETALRVSVTGRITITDLAFVGPGGLDGSRELEFGPCGLNEFRDLPLEVVNRSRLSQVVRFTSSNACVAIVHDDCDLDGLIYLGPEARVTRRVRFAPTHARKYNGRLMCHTAWGRRFEIVSHGVGVPPIIRFLQTTAYLSPAGLGSVLDMTFAVGVGDFTCEDEPMADRFRKKNREHAAAGSVTYSVETPVVVSIETRGPALDRLPSSMEDKKAELLKLLQHILLPLDRATSRSTRSSNPDSTLTAHLAYTSHPIGVKPVRNCQKK
ncbi:hypothetical protein HK405_012552 [Cladochytrium tenue]|nr:hypothetical protein HK405_012552 [Cladochytrium tenue]